MRTLDDVRIGLSQGATAAEAAKCAKDIASGADATALRELVSMLADAVITPPKRGRGGQPNLTLETPGLSAETQMNLVGDRTAGNVALSEYAYIVNARNIADGRRPEYAGYGVKMSKDEAIQYLKDRKLYAHGRQGIKSRAKSYAMRKVTKLARITTDEFDKLRREKLSAN